MLMVMLSVCMCCAGVCHVNGNAQCVHVLYCAGAGLSDATELSGGSDHGPAAAGLCVLQHDLSLSDSHTLLSILR